MQEDHIHFAAVTSCPLPTVHTITSISLAGLSQRLATETPATSAFDDGPYASLNHMFTLIDQISDPVNFENLRCLETEFLTGNPMPPSESSASTSDAEMLPPHDCSPISGAPAVASNHPSHSHSALVAGPSRLPIESMMGIQ